MRESKEEFRYQAREGFVVVEKGQQIRIERSASEPLVLTFPKIHDLDANKPAGSQKIRVRTYAHTLQRYQEELEDCAARKSELERNVTRRRFELLEARRASLAGHELEDMQRAYRDYLEEEEQPDNRGVGAVAEALVGIEVMDFGEGQDQRL